MYKAIIVSEDNLEHCKMLLSIHQLPQRCLHYQTWIVWGNADKPEVRLLPHRVFKKKYEVVGNTENYYIVEKL